MPNRVIKESIKRSAQIDSLTWFEEVVYYRLIVTADDYGCVDGRAILLKNELFPLKENVTKKSVEEAIYRLVKAGLLYSYEVSGIPYLLFPTWERHQRIRNKHRKYPAPECLTANGGHMSANCCQMPATCQSESESEVESEVESEFLPPIIPPQGEGTPKRKRRETKAAPDWDPERFAGFWAMYPRGEKKQAAIQAWDNLRPSGEVIDTMARALKRQVASEEWQRGVGIPYASTYLNQRRWEDEVKLPAKAALPSDAGRYVVETSEVPEW